MKIVVDKEEVHAILSSWAEKNGYEVVNILDLEKGYELSVKNHNPKTKILSKKKQEPVIGVDP